MVVLNIKILFFFATTTSGMLIRAKLKPWTYILSLYIPVKLICDYIHCLIFIT